MLSNEVLVQGYNVILAALVQLNEYGPESKDAGICYHVGDLWYGDSNDELRREFNNYPSMWEAEVLDSAMKVWPKFSGNSWYPVPHPTTTAWMKGEDEDDDSEYCPHEIAFCQMNKWDKTTEYGQSRWELVDFLIVHFQGKVNKLKGEQG